VSHCHTSGWLGETHTDRLWLIRWDHMSRAIEQSIRDVPLLVDDSGEITIRVREWCARSCCEAADAPESSVLNSHYKNASKS
jgi:hypothetical protein